MIKIYTDGSAVAKRNSYNHMKGGIGIVFVLDGDIILKVSKGYYPTKIGRMELMAVLTALRALDKSQSAIIYSDSMYVVNCFNKNWLKNWERYCWSDRIKNKDILRPLLDEYRKFRPGAIRLSHVKGHSGDEFNEIADRLASYKNFDEFEEDIVDIERSF